MTTEFIEIREPIKEGETFQHAVDRIEQMSICAIGVNSIIQNGDEAIGRIPFPVADLMARLLNEEIIRNAYHWGGTCPCKSGADWDRQHQPLKFRDDQ